MHAIEIVKRPLVTEKNTEESETHNRYAFLVDMRARKPDIKRAVEELYGVRVEKVATQIRKGRLRRTRHGHVRTAPWKRAMVYLHGDDRIEVF